jgi:hypothetical protein
MHVLVAMVSPCCLRNRLSTAVNDLISWNHNTQLAFCNSVAIFSPAIAAHLTAAYTTNEACLKL